MRHHVPLFPLLHPHQDDRRHHVPVPDGGLEGLERFDFHVNFAPDPGVDHDLAERNIQILRADGVSAAVSGGLFVLFDRPIAPFFVRWFTIGLRHPVL